MKLWIRTQDKKRIVCVESVALRGKNLKLYSQQYPLGLLLGKYDTEERAMSVMDTIFTKLKSNGSADLLFEMPENF
ncbi:MAG: hypothetical protein ABFR75_10700 [Acidobacteriota bacterium]